MSCFTDFITVTGACSNSNSTSDYSLKDVGVMLSELNDIVTKDYATGKALGEAKIEFARKLVVSEIHAHFSDKYQTKSIIENQRLGYPLDNMPVVAGEAGYYKGIEIETCNTDSFLSVYISDISLFCDYTGNVNVLVYDLKQKKLLDTLTIAAVANETVTSYVGKTYQSDRKELDLAFIYNSQGINSYKTYVKQGGCPSCGTLTSSVYVNPYIRARGIKVLGAADKLQENFTGTGDTAGLQVNFNVNCNYDSWLCSIRNKIALPILYKSAQSIMEFALHTTDRENSRTIIDVEKTEGRMNFYADKYKESIGAILKNMKLPADKCFSCKSPIKYTTILP